jgi:hypothetical protein
MPIHAGTCHGGEDGGLAVHPVHAVLCAVSDEEVACRIGYQTKRFSNLRIHGQASIASGSIPDDRGDDAGFAFDAPYAKVGGVGERRQSGASEKWRLVMVRAASRAASRKQCSRRKE